MRETESSRPGTRRVALVAVALLALYVVARQSGFIEWFSVEQVRARVQAAGPLGPLSFMLVLVLGVVVQIPAIPLVLAAPALFDSAHAWLWCTLAGNLAVVVNFALVRRLGGKALLENQSPWLRKLLASIDTHPVRTVALVRMVTIMLPPVTSALALTGLRARDHFIGSLIGLPLPITALIAAASYAMD